MNLHQLRVFDAVARQHSFSKAAIQLGLSQPTVSVHLQKLEEDLGIELVEQLGKAIYLTPAGQVLFGYTKRIINLLHESEQALAEIKGIEQGVLHLGSSTTPGNFLLPGILADFKLEHPQIEVHFLVANSAKIAQKVLANELDLGVVGHGVTPNLNLISLPLWQDNLAVILSPKNPLCAKEKLDFTDFTGHNLILREQGSGTRLVIEEAFAKAQVSLTPTMEFTGTEGIKQAVAANLGLSIVSQASVRQEEQAGTIVLRQIKGVELSRQFNLIQHKDKNSSPLATAFITHLQKAVLGRNEHLPAENPGAANPS